MSDTSATGMEIDRCSPSLSQACFSLPTDCSTSERGKFCGANETTVQRLRGAGRKNCRLTTFHVPCVPVCYSMLDSASERRKELDSPSQLGLKGQRWTPGTGCREVEAGEREFPWDEGQLAYQSGRKTASSCSRGTAPTLELRVVNEERES